MKTSIIFNLTALIILSGFFIHRLNKNLNNHLICKIDGVTKIYCGKSLKSGVPLLDLIYMLHLPNNTVIIKREKIK